jgi:ribosomal protein S18 acetylase RimI-like enzyme
MQRSAHIRGAIETDLGFMREMLFEAFFWDARNPRPSFEVFSADAEFLKLLDDWGRAGDRAVIAEQDGMSLGAAWFRLWTPEWHSYGYVDSGVPEVGMGVKQGHRSRGIGRALLASLVEIARSESFAALSLSVSPNNYAFSLYTSMGFHRVGESGSSWTLLLPLGCKDGDA